MSQSQRRNIQTKIWKNNSGSCSTSITCHFLLEIIIHTLILTLARRNNQEKLYAINKSFNHILNFWPIRSRILHLTWKEVQNKMEGGANDSCRSRTTSYNLNLTTNNPQPLKKRFLPSLLIHNFILFLKISNRFWPQHDHESWCGATIHLIKSCQCQWILASNELRVCDMNRVFEDQFQLGTSILRCR